MPKMISGVQTMKAQITAKRLIADQFWPDLTRTLGVALQNQLVALCTVTTALLRNQPCRARGGLD